MKDQFKSHTIKVNNIQISYNDLGKGDLPIIFIHGFPFDKSMWQPQMEFLSSAKRVIAYDIRGFGETENDTTELSIKLFAEDLVNFMDALTIKKATICGLSMGGYIVLAAINNYPEKFAKLILADTQCIADTTEGVEKRHKTIDQINTEGTDKFIEGFIKSAFHKKTIKNNKPIVNNIKNIITTTSTKTITSGLNALANRQETCSTLNSISVPTLILCGKQDELTPVKQSEFMNNNIKNSVLKIIDNAGHLSNLEQPDEFNKLLLRFIS